MIRLRQQIKMTNHITLSDLKDLKEALKIQINYDNTCTYRNSSDVDFGPCADNIDGEKLLSNLTYVDYLYRHPNIESLLKVIPGNVLAIRYPYSDDISSFYIYPMKVHAKNGIIITPPINHRTLLNKVIKGMNLLTQKGQLTW